MPPIPTARPLKYAAQPVMGTSTLTGAAPESAMYDNFSLETLALSEMLLIVVPTNKGLNESLKYTNIPNSHAKS